MHQGRLGQRAKRDMCPDHKVYPQFAVIQLTQHEAADSALSNVQQLTKSLIFTLTNTDSVV